MTATVRPQHSWPVGVAILAILLAAAALRAQGRGAYFIPGDPQTGMRAFFDKGCARCHALLGEGGRSAPDLARAPGGLLSAGDLVAAMWNHAPSMWDKMRQEHFTPPKFEESEMANLFAFLYSVRSLDEPGNPERGRRLLAEKKCLVCHSVVGQGGRAGPDLKNWASYRNPVSWLQAMWNHAPAMKVMMAQRGLAWPQFQGSDVADLIAYIRTVAATSKNRVYLRPGDPEAGRRIMQDKGCTACHAIHGEGGRRGPDFGARQWPRTLGQFAGLMWNHAPEMWASMQAQKIPRPQFSNKEMADLIAYLFSQRYFEAAGNATQGRRMFQEKGCAGCHPAGGGSGTGPDLARWRGGASPIPVATALWNHGPVMLARMQQAQIPWPRLAAKDIADLLEYLGQSPAAQKAQAKRP